MRLLSTLPLLTASFSLAVAGCGAGADFPTTRCKDLGAETCIEIAAGDSAALLEEANLLSDDTVLVLAEGTYAMPNTLTLRNAGISLVGQGMEATILDFAGSAGQNGVDVVGDRFLIEALTVRDAAKDGVRVEASDEVVFRAVKATWSTPGQSTNGAYGIYPVKSSRVLVEDCVAEHASDAGLYVGQSRHVIVRRNHVHHNVAGLEIENTQFADVHDNLVEENTGGLVVFDLPGNPIVGRDVHFHDNQIRNNNHDNFAPGGTVAQIPPGTGTFALASRRVLIENNSYEGNNTVDIAILNGLALDVGGTPDTGRWELDPATLVGDNSGLVLDPADTFPGGTAGRVTNLRSYDVVVGANSFSGSGTYPNNGNGEQPLLGFYLQVVYDLSGATVDNLLYDAILEPGFAAGTTDPNGANTNQNTVCLGGASGATFASLDMEHTVAELAAGGIVGTGDLYRPAHPFPPFDCTAFAATSPATVQAPDMDAAPEG